MKRLIAVGLLLLVAAASIQLLPGAEHVQAATTNVSVNNDFFSPAPVTITVGDTVHWDWVGSDHSVTADDASFDSGIQNAGATFEMTFNTPGTFHYYCKIHGGPGGIGMSGVINVQAAAATPTSVAATPTAQATGTNTALATATGQATGTATGTATMTPTSAATATMTPLASTTPLPSVSASPNTPTPAPATTAAGPTSPGGGMAGVGAALPSTGEGRSSAATPVRPVGIVLALFGFAAIGAGIVLKRRRA
jgi:plastocyanin